MATKIELNGYDYSATDKKFVKKTLNYNEPNSSKAYAHGDPVGVVGAKELIKNYWEQLKAEMGEDKAKKESIAFTFGKEKLLALLSQEDCVGVKFYIGKRISSERPDDFIGTWEGKTLVAIGVRGDAAETEIGARVDYLARGINDAIAQNNLKGDDDAQPGLVVEMVPPFSVADVPPLP